MDEIEHLVSQTYKHLDDNFTKTDLLEEKAAHYEYPIGPGVLYHIQKTSSIFVIRTLVSKNIGPEYQAILETPENYPSLRLLEDGQDACNARLRFFLVEDAEQAEIIHDQLNNRRFPIDEEMMCNLSDPGFSWWLTKKPEGFVVSFTMSVSNHDHTVKLGPLGDHALALKNFQILEGLMTSSGLDLNIQNEANRVQFTDGEALILDELKDLFEYGVVSETLGEFFKLIAKPLKDHSDLETIWFYLQELAAMRRFWIQVQYDLNS